MSRATWDRREDGAEVWTGAAEGDSVEILDIPNAGAAWAWIPWVKVRGQVLHFDTATSKEKARTEAVRAYRAQLRYLDSLR
jgi:hypothetical protein